jgi:hypothetical protein
MALHSDTMRRRHRHLAPTLRNVTRRKRTSQEGEMDGSFFDAWTRRHFGVASGSLIASLLTANLATNVTAKKRRKKKKCGKRRKRCHGKCVKKSLCCGDGDCPANTYCCEGDCVSLDRPCHQDGTYACFADGVLRLSVEEEVFCTRTSDLPICALCTSSEGCLADERCFPANCAEDVAAVCRKVYVGF